LGQAYAKTHKEVMTKETIVYTADKTDDGFQCSIACEKFEDVYSGEGPSAKAAQDEAAKAALQKEFPVFFKDALKLQKQSSSTAKSSGACAAPSPADPARRLLPWRSQLAEAYARKYKVIKKGDISYSTDQVDPPKQSFVSTLSSENFADSYTGEAGRSKGFAEDNAAMVAMKAEFPEEFAASNAPTTNKGFQRLKRKANQENEDGDKKPVNENPKSKLNTSLMLLTGGAITKDALEYTTSEKDEKTMAILVVKCLGGQKKFKGEAVDGTGKQSKKEAEQKAAAAALKSLAKQISVAEAKAVTVRAEREAKKKSEWGELLAKKKEEKAAEKAEKAKATKA